MNVKKCFCEFHYISLRYCSCFYLFVFSLWGNNADLIPLKRFLKLFLSNCQFLLDKGVKQGCQTHFALWPHTAHSMLKGPDQWKCPFCQCKEATYLIPDMCSYKTKKGSLHSTAQFFYVINKCSCRKERNLPAWLFGLKCKTNVLRAL